MRWSLRPASSASWARWHEVRALHSLGSAQLGIGDQDAARASWRQALATLETSEAQDTPELSRVELRACWTTREREALFAWPKW